MAVLDFDSNALFGEDGSGKLYIATDYDGSTLADGTGTNEKAQVTTLEAFTFGDLGYFQNFEAFINNGDEKVITTDYCGQGEITRKSEKVSGFSFDMQEVLEMSNLALLLGAELMTETGVKYISMKRQFKTRPYQLFKFESCPKDGKKNVMYFVKAVLTGDIALPVVNLTENDFAGVTIEHEVARGGNHLIVKDVAVV